MSRRVDNALEKVKNSSFRFIDDHTLEVLNAVIVWSNFSGEKDRFGNSARKFDLALTKQVADELRELGWRVREYKQSEDATDDETLYYVNIKINLLSNYPPKIMLYTEFNGKRSATQLIGENVSELDRIDIKDADCTINAYTSPSYPDKVSGYLKKLHVIQEIDSEFGGKYDDWTEEIDFQEANKFAVD